MKFVIIGGDAAGMSAASKAKRTDPSLEVVVFEQTEDVSYSACGMPYNIADPTRSMNDLVVRHAEIFREKQGIDLRIQHRVERIDRHRKTVSGHTRDGQSFTERYDRLLIATGARPKVLPIPGATLRGVFALKSLEDGQRLKAFLAQHRVEKAVIIGAGYIGLEMAEAFHARGLAVEICEGLPRLLPFLPDEMAAVVREELERNDVVLHFNATIDSIEENGGKLSVQTDDQRLSADIVLMAIGIAPNAELARDAGLELGAGGAIAVDRTLRTSDPDIFAAGDCADAFHIITSQRVWIPLALRANRSGWVVADNVTGRAVEVPGVAGTAVFKVMELEVARTGLTPEDAVQAGFEPVQELIRSRSRAHAHPGNQSIYVNLVADRKTRRLLGGSMVGKEGVAHRINAVAVALHAGMTVDELFLCDFAYAPPFSPVWDPVLTAANQLLKKL